MVRKWASFFLFCFLIHTLVFAFFPRKHLADRLPYALINETLTEDIEEEEILEEPEYFAQHILLEIMDLSEEFSDMGQSNFHLKPNRFYSSLALGVYFFLKAHYFLFQESQEEKPSPTYSGILNLLPEYYSFLFRLTPF